MVKKGPCPTPRTIATGERECPRCGAIWDRADGPPDCPAVDSKPAKRVSARRKIQPEY